MAKLLIVRTYPRPGESWRAWTVSVDGRVVGKIRGAGCLTIEVEPKAHKLTARGGRQLINDPLALTTSRDQDNVVLMSRGGLNEGGDEITARVCHDLGEIPRSAIPAYSPSGTQQNYQDGVRRAWTALSIAIGLGFLLVAAGLGLLISVTVAKDASLAGPGIILIVIGSIILVKFRPGFRLLFNQRNWPFPNVRVEHKGDELVEWKRFTADKA